ncbi:hypothetical protein BDZ91DRAFT_735935 [Kalaharituber pfeilii]|nr:hypothetical protein BDZ91DRAFT_735935 [Kalaharituber pfeilii]
MGHLSRKRSACLLVSQAASKAKRRAVMHTVAVDISRPLNLSMMVDIYNELMKNTINVDFSTVKFKYQSGVQVFRQTV